MWKSTILHPPRELSWSVPAQVDQLEIGVDKCGACILDLTVSFAETVAEVAAISSWEFVGTTADNEQAIG